MRKAGPLGTTGNWEVNRKGQWAGKVLEANMANRDQPGSGLLGGWGFGKKTCVGMGAKGRVRGGARAQEGSRKHHQESAWEVEQ